MLPADGAAAQRWALTCEDAAAVHKLTKKLLTGKRTP